MVKHFTDDDVKDGRIIADTKELVKDEPEWMRRGLQQTASGYGARLNTGRKIHFNGRLYRLYATCYSNAASVWFKTRGRTIHVS